MTTHGEESVGRYQPHADNAVGKMEEAQRHVLKLVIIPGKTYLDLIHFGILPKS